MNPSTTSTPTTWPAVFVSHGSPTFALEPGLAGPQLRALGQTLGKPRAVVVVSPHWMTRGVRVTGAARPETVHDFGGFPRALYALQYPAPGAPELADQIVALLQAAGLPASVDAERGLDHGAWVPMMHLYPDADVPVLQVSLPADADEVSALALGRALAPLAGQGVLVVGSGSLTHNLYEVRFGDTQASGYAREFTDWIHQAVRAGDVKRLQNALDEAPHGRRSHPTTEHYLPLLVAAGAASAPLPATVLDGGIEHGVLAMASYVFGRELAMNAS